MDRKFIIVILLVLLSACEKSQDQNDIVIKYYGDALEDIGYSIVPTGDGYIIGGQLTKVSRRESNYIDIPASVKQTGIVRTNFNGEEIWKKSYGKRMTGNASKVLALDDGSFIATGFVTDTITFQKNIFVIKTGADGLNTVEKIFKLTGNQTATDIIQMPGGGFMVLATTDVVREPVTESTGNAAGKKDILLLRINSNLDQTGAPLAVGFPGNDYGASIKNDINGGYIVVGTTDRSDQNPGQQAGNNILLVRINSDGSTIQPRILGGKNDEYAADFEVLNDGYIIAGTIGAEGTAQQPYAWGLSSDIYAVPAFSDFIDLEPELPIKTSVSLKAICRYKTNSFIIAGQFGSGSSGRMLFFVADANGKYIDGTKKVFGGTGSQVAYDVTSDESNNIIGVGKNSYENNSMISLVKFRF